MVSSFVLQDMAPRTKKIAGKRPREPSPEPEDPHFHIPEHQARFTRLSALRFGQSRHIDLSIVREIQGGAELAEELEELFSVGGWAAIRSLTLEVLATFEFD